MTANSAARVIPPEAVRFVMLVLDTDGERGACLAVQSLRRFGGRWRACPFWIFLPDPTDLAPALADMEGVQTKPLEIDTDFPPYIFSAKVHACAQAEALAGPDVHTLIWLSSTTLFAQPPDLFHLGTAVDAAFRPVHIRNVGLLVDEPLDAYWASIYQAVGVDDQAYSVESFVDDQKLRPYFNSHLFAINPAHGVMQAWLRYFKGLVLDEAFQSGSCANQLERIFLHQAVLSALLPTMLEWERIRLLPPEYSYPLHLHQEVPKAKQPGTLNETVCPVYESSFHYPDTLNGLRVENPIQTWLERHAS